jgi:hypothetical protein
MESCNPPAGHRVVRVPNVRSTSRPSIEGTKQMKQETVIVGGQPGAVLAGNTFVAGGYEPRQRDFQAERAADRVTRKEAEARFFKLLEVNMSISSCCVGVPYRR